MDTFRRQLETFRNRYIRLLKEPETQGLSTTLFQAGDVLIGSAQVWVRQVKAEAGSAAVTPKGSSPRPSGPPGPAGRGGPGRGRTRATGQRPSPPGSPR